MRGGFKIEKCSDERPEQERKVELSGWFKNFKNNAHKYVTSVEVARHTQPSIYEQLNAIMNGKRGLYSSVEEAVKDYQEKTGLKAYLNQIKAEELNSNVEKVAKQILAASEEFEEKKTLKPDFLVKNPSIDRYIESIVNTNPYMQIPAILYLVGEAFINHGISQSDLNDPELARYINSLLIEKAAPIHYGEPVFYSDVNTISDIGNTDAFSGLRPASRY